MATTDSPLSGINILVLDDETAVPMAKLLTIAGAKTVIARSIYEAREKLAADPDWFNVAVIDLLLLNGSGSDLIRELKITHPNIGCVLISGMDLYTMGLEKYLGEFIMKPVSIEVLIEAIHRARAATRDRSDTEPSPPPSEPPDTER